MAARAILREPKGIVRDGMIRAKVRDFRATALHADSQAIAQASAEVSARSQMTNRRRMSAASRSEECGIWQR